MAYFRTVTKLLIGIIIFVGLPVAGWGVTDVQGFIGHPARLGYIILIILLQFLVVIILPEAGSSRGKGKNPPLRQRVILLLIQLLSLVIVVSAPYCDRRHIAMLCEGDMVRYTGLGLFLAGFMLMHWTEGFLGKQFSVEITIQDGHKLITDGPYRYIRHPRYLGIIIFTAGISLVFNSTTAIVLAAMLALVLIVRIRDEEALMHKEFGTDWESYSKKSRRLVPFIY